MPNMAVGQRVLVTAVGSYFGQRTMTTWLYRVSAITGSVGDVTFFTALDTKFQAALGLLDYYKKVMPYDNQWHGEQAWYQIIAPTRFRKVARNYEGIGSFDAPSTTANVSAAISRFGDVADRKNQGGVRVPIATGACTEGLINDDLKEALTNLASEMNLIQTVSGVSLVPQVGTPGGKKVDGVWVPGNPMASVDQTSTVVQDTTRVMRRRTVRVGI